ncbi:nose resistant to fluoxetine protein 6-like [Topomyia yanbarensis]|uniref:nose resistant to fluoxetine protein 6-like n=1 Tax=Topomyia yanbarensis TaxID=2498891 RepID=UPI00273B4489|nr:nose resistant to fluoxetine protein 6-like [Topomyia yanbarensis]
MSICRSVFWAFVLVQLNRAALIVRGYRFYDQNTYDSFPKLYDYDDFEECRRIYREQYIYCVVRARISPDEESLLWKNLSRFSEDQFRYDRRVHERGLCVQDCERTSRTAELSKANQEGYTYADLFKSCINLKLQKNHNLQIDSDVEIFHCYSKVNENPPLDYTEILFITTVGLILVLVFFSTWIDLKLQTRQRFPEQYFSKRHGTSRERLLTSFSLPRSIRRLKDPVSSPIRRELNFLEGFRFIQMHRVIVLHIILGLVKVPKVNPEALEQKLYAPIMVHYVAEFQNYIQTFLSISGMLVVVNFLEHTRKNPEFRAGYFWDRLVARLVRIVPAYLFTILLEASISRRFMDGPVGEHFVGDSRAKCRRIWWANVLFINNYLSTDQPCLIQSWYLATDLQLFIFAMAALMLIWRWPILKKYIFGAAFAWGLVFTTIYVYLRSVPPVMTEDLKLNTQYNFGNRYFQLYQPFHMNIAIYFVGMLAGFIYHRYREARKEVLHSPLLMIVFRISLVLYFFTIFSDNWVVRHQDTLHPVLSAIYATLFKHSWGVLCTVIQLRTALQPQRSRFRSFFSHPIFAVLGKLCYSFYLIHFIVVLQVVGSVKQPIYFSVRTVFEYIMTIQIWTLLFGVLLCVLVELPSHVALTELLESKKDSEPTKHSDESIAVEELPNGKQKPKRDEK